jgi:translation initiation factor IF-2
MTDTKNPGGDKTLGLGKTLTLKRPVEQGTVKQSFSHGRSKQVVVEKVKRRVIGPGDKPESASPQAAAAARKPAPSAPAPQAAPSAPSKAPSAPRTPGVVLRTLTSDEIEARDRALADSRLREADDRVKAEADAQRRAAEDARRLADREAAEARKRDEETRRTSEEETRKKAEDAAKKRLGDETAATAPRGRVTKDEEEESPRAPIRRPGMPVRPVVPPKPERTKAGQEKQRGRLTLTTAFESEEERARSVAAFRRRVQRMTGKVSAEPKEKLIREVVIPETITIQELANRMAERAVDVIRLLMKQGEMKKINDVIDADTAQLIAEEMGHSVRRVAESDVEEGLFDAADEEGAAVSRPPVVTIMGHVDHGKTSLLDAIRQTNVVSGEAGGITQHIGAYQVKTPAGSLVTFIDTPGHEAFTAMRQRGAKATDIVVLVVAADDGVMPQTAEAINHAKAAGVPIIVAINKIDKQGAKPERVRTELLQHELQVESLGGEILEVEVSATKKQNLDKLLELIALQAELLDLKANPERAAEGIVIEAKLDKGRGPVATVLIQRGTLKGGDIIVAGSEWGRVRALINDQGKAVSEAGPSLPVEILGFQGAPEAGDRLAVVENEARAREVTEYRQRQRRDLAAARSGRGGGGSIEQMMTNLKTAAGRQEFPLVIKGDVQGSVEAIIQALAKLGTDEVVARVLHAGVGGITESDITLAGASGAAVLGFNVRALKEAREAGERTGTEIRYYNIIYDLVDDIRKAMSGLLAPERREEFLGNAEILEVFNISKVGKVAGCKVTEGRVERGAGVRLIRDNVVVHEGKLSTLKRFKDEVKEVQTGQECGMAFENYGDMRVGDVIECYRVETIQRSL